MIFDYYNLGIISFRTLALTLFGVVLLFFAAFILRRLRVNVPLVPFASFYAVLALAGIFVPPMYWLWLYLSLIIAGIVSGVLSAVLFRFIGALSLSARYAEYTSLAFTDCDDTIILATSQQSGRRSRLALRLCRFLSLRLAGSDSPHFVVPELSLQFMPEARDAGIALRTELAVSYVLRGHDANSFLFCSLGWIRPLKFLIPWQMRLAIRLPEITVLSATFSRLAVSSRIRPRLEMQRQHPTMLISRMSNDSFLHLGSYSAGEPLSRIDVKASMRSADIISKKYARTIDIVHLLALGFGRRVFSSGSADRMMAELGTVLSESRATGASTELAIFDMTKRYQENLGTDAARMLSFAKTIASLRPEHYEEDEFSILDGLGQRLKYYTHLTILVAWGGHFDISRAIEAASVFRRSGTSCEIRVVAAGVFSVLNQRKESPESAFFYELINTYTAQASKRGIAVHWIEK